MSQNTNLASLKSKRGRIKSSLTRFKTVLNSYTPQKIAELRSRLERIQLLWSQFEEVQNEIGDILTVEGNSDDEYANEQNHFENLYFQLVADATTILDQAASASSASQPSAPSMPNPYTAHHQAADLNIRLPQINLPEFSGSYEHWLQFYDTFNALINNNQSLSAIHTFYYLKSSLKGDAAEIIRALDKSVDNYTIARNLLQERYENKRVIIQAHMKGIFEIPSSFKESHLSLRKLLDTFQKHFRSLKALGQPVDAWDTILIFVLSSKLDNTTKREWETSINKATLPTINDFVVFVSNKCQLLETIETKNDKYNNKPKTLSHVSVSTFKCSFCNKPEHKIQACDNFLKLNVSERFTEVKKRGLCVNCLRAGHFSSNCNGSNCRVCKQRHNTLLHFESRTQGNTEQSKNGRRSEVHESSLPAVINEISAQCVHRNNSVILPTAVVNVSDYEGNLIKARVLLDSGSQSNFVSRCLLRKLKLKTQRTNVPVKGINEVAISISERVDLSIQSIVNSYKKKLSFLVIDNITDNIPQIGFDLDCINIPKNIRLSDSELNSPEKIDLLLGANIFFELLCIGQIKTGDKMPILQNTKLGWIISGPLLTFNQNNQVNCNMAIDNCADLQGQLERFWQMEECAPKRILTPEELECENSFKQNVQCTSSGNFKVKLPLKENVVDLGESKNIAERRFYQLERKLSFNSVLKGDYSQFISEYIRLGHATKIPSTSEGSLNYYMPHHCVIKEASTTTKLRVVFDASSKTSSNISLNDILKVGPNLQDDIFSILLRFRIPNFVIVGDIEKMYRQVYIDESQRSLQRILWRDNEGDPLETYELNTVTYGTASASFLAVRALHEAAFTSPIEFQDAREVILRDFYVDDLLTGRNDIAELIKLKEDIVEILKKRGFILRKFKSNCREVLTDNDVSTEAEYPLMGSTENKTLGLTWNSNGDTFHYKYDVFAGIRESRVTKRTILSLISKLFDPLGLIGPCIVRAKIILQHLWQLKMDWDQAIPNDLHTMWSIFYTQIGNLHELVIPRQATTFDQNKIEIHGFSDASESAYGAAIYVVTEHLGGVRHSRLLCAKSRVAPLKKISLPRLELCDAILLAQLVDKLRQALQNVNAPYFLWCDSTIVLSWLAASPQWQIFVANRVTQIQELTKSDVWQHVTSSHNPADVISRGMNPRELSECKLWWNGPAWLESSSENWPKTSINVNISIPEAKEQSVISAIVTPDDSLLNKFSSLTKLQRVTAFVMRFTKNCRIKNDKDRIKTNSLSAEEISFALKTLIKISQKQTFAQELAALKSKSVVGNNSKLVSLSPFLDEDEIIRVGGRLKQSELHFNQKHPMVLSNKCNLTKLIIRREHYRNLHVGAQTLLAILRQTYWMLGARNVVRSTLRSCLICFRANPKCGIYAMGDLPSPRVTASRPFYSSGVDYAGPFLIKDGVTRSRKIVKAYICIFVCLATKAVHMKWWEISQLNPF